MQPVLQCDNTTSIPFFTILWRMMPWLLISISSMSAQKSYTMQVLSQADNNNLLFMAVFRVNLDQLALFWFLPPLAWTEPEPLRINGTAFLRAGHRSRQPTPNYWRNYCIYYCIHLTAFFPVQPGKPASEKQNHSGKTNLDLQEQETVSGSGISWAICKSAPRLRQITIPESHHSVFYRPDALPAT